MKAKAWRLYGASDLRLEDVELAAAGADGVALFLLAWNAAPDGYAKPAPKPNGGTAI